MIWWTAGIESIFAAEGADGFFYLRGWLGDA
jgi:hypothetical protein